MIDQTRRSLILLTAMMGLPQSSVLGAEPLPPRALARLGDHRFYHGPGIECAVLSADGKRAASTAHYPSYLHHNAKDRDAYDTLIVLWDAVTGARLRELHSPASRVGHLALSADGKRLAAAYASDADRKAGIVVFEAASGKTLWRLEDSSLVGVVHLQFSTDGKQLRGSGSSIRVWEAATGKQLRLCKPSKTLDNRARACWGMLSPDGKVVVWEMRREYRVATVSDGLRVHDADTDQLLYQMNLKVDDRCVASSTFVASFTFSADGKRFAADCGHKLIVWETATGKELATLRIGEPIVCFALAPDGRRVVIDENSRLRLWDIETEKPLREQDAGFDNLKYKFLRASPAFSANGKTLLLAADSTLRLFDVETAAERAALGHRSPVAPRYSVDGRTLVTSCAEKRCRWDVSKPTPILMARESRKSWERDCLAYSGDGLLCLHRSETGVRLREIATGRIQSELEKHDPGLILVPEGWLAPDASRALLWEVGKRSGDKDRQWFQLYDAKTGKALGEIKRLDKRGDPAFSPTGRLAAFVDFHGDVPLYDTVVCKLVRTLHSSRMLPQSSIEDAHLLFSPDGEQLIVWICSERRFFEKRREGVRLPMRVFHVSSGREIARFYANPEKSNKISQLSCMACSPDNRLLAVAEEESEIIRVVELASGKVRAEFAGHRHGVHGLAFAPDGKTLASGGEDNVVFLWDVTGAKTPIADNKSSDNDLSALWNDLSSEDGKRAGDAIASLLRKPEVSAAFLQEKLHPVEALDEMRLAQWIADLDSDVFEKREEASRELTRLGERAEEALRRELTNRPSLEMRRRIEDILDKLEPSSPPPETLRTLRAIEVLEHIGTPAARRCLEALAKGAVDARPTRDAKAALRRLVK